MALSRTHTKEMIESIKVEREQVSNEVERLVEKLNALDVLLETYGVRATKPRPKKIKPASEPLTGDAQPYAEPDYSGLTQAEAAYRFLYERGESTHVDTIVNALMHRGIAFRGKDDVDTPEQKKLRLKQSLVSTLLRDGRFVNLGKNQYWLSELSEPLGTGIPPNVLNGDDPEEELVEIPEEPEFEGNPL